MANNFRFEIKGDADLLRAFELLGPRVELVVKGSLRRSGEEIATASKSKYVPIDTGNLMNTIHVQNAERIGNEIVVKIVAGGPAAPYAVHVHEINKNYRNGRQWKYLETPAKEAYKDIIEELRVSVLEALRG